jgi:[pyruvate, water dikinase]-phosphate phosphotransferase / [pyruvate, water dikinase] kinase
MSHCGHVDMTTAFSRLRLAVRRRTWLCPPLSTATNRGSERTFQSMSPDSSFFHLHLVSDSTGETLITVARAASAQYSSASPVEHIYPAVRTGKQLDRVLEEIAEAPGLVLYTLLDQALIGRLEGKCRDLGLPCLSVLGPVLHLFETYLGAESTYRVGAQHILNAEYFKRIDALNYTMMHDDGQHCGAEEIEQADVVLVGVSRTSKTPTSIYLANRGVKTANIPLVLGVPVPSQLDSLKHPLVVGLYASPERVVQMRENRLLGMRVQLDDDQYVDRKAVTEEIAFSRRLCAKHNWPLIDVTRRSIEETAAAVMALLAERRRSPVED